jgi:acylphosphatase
VAERTLLARYQGEVQGVGFRATVQRLAGGFAVKGWVKNEPDGSVLMIASGEAREVDAFLAAIRASRLGPLIERETLEPQGSSEGLEGFGVRR